MWRPVGPQRRQPACPAQRAPPRWSAGLAQEAAWAGVLFQVACMLPHDPLSQQLCEVGVKKCMPTTVQAATRAAVLVAVLCCITI